jgi:prepilin-type N-terminal cleavage/methylation domain-containing protein
MLTQTHMRHRPGFTLIEMLVVLGIILVLATLAVVFYPKLQDSNQMIRGSDLVVQALSSARQRAKRDGLPTGIRFEVDPATKYITQFEYIQQPDNYTFGACLGTYFKPTTPPGGPTPMPAFVCFGGVDFKGSAAGLGVSDQATIMPGDYLEVFGGGGLFLVKTVLPLGTLPGAPGNGWLEINNMSQLISPTTNYRIIRQPRKLTGEDPITLPRNLVLDTNLISSNNAIPVRLPPPSGLGIPTTGFYEILFSPSGSVIGKGTGGDKIILWLHDLTQPTLEAPDPFAGSPVLISVQVRTGFIAANPVGPKPPGDPFVYTKDPRSSGM